MRARLFEVVGRHPRLMKRLAKEILAGYQRPPTDRPRELARFVLVSGALSRKSRTWRHGSPVPVLAPPTVMTRRTFPVPPLDDATSLAEHFGLTIDELVNLADTTLATRRAPSQRIAHYRYRWLVRPSGARLIEAPKPRMAGLQRKILDEILSAIPVHPAAHGFVPGRSAVTGATLHVGAQVLVTLDLEHFFAAVTAGRVWGILRAAGYPEPVAHLLTGLITHATPVAVLAGMPLGVDPDRNFRLRRRLATPHLPQGAPTSPQLANLVAHSLDRRLAAYADSIGVTYTRYADDLSFSGGPDLARQAPTLIRAVQRFAQAEGFGINPAKSRVRRDSQRQLVTGIVVNRRTNVTRADYDRLKSVLHDCRRRGPEVANREAHPDFRAHLLGRISWVTALNPERGAKLRAAFDAVDWA